MMKKLISMVLVLLVAVGSFGFALAEPTSPITASVTKTPAGEVCIVGHRATLAAQAEGVTAFSWKSSSSKRASVSANGAVRFKKAGDVTITAKSKGSVKAEGAIVLTIVANRKDTDASRVYLKGNYVYADVLYTNAGTKSVKKLKNATIALSGVAGVEGIEASFIRSGVAKKAVKPGASGFVTFKLRKVATTQADLTKAVASIVPAA